MILSAVWLCAAGCSNSLSAPANQQAGAESGGGGDAAPEVDSFAADGQSPVDVDDGSGVDANDEDGQAELDLVRQDVLPKCSAGTACTFPCCPSAACNQAGNCQCLQPICDDQNPCTVDLCDAATCSHAPSATSACNDGDLCTMSDACTGGTCAGTPVVCDDQNPCTVDLCDAATCTNLPASASPCNDSDPCTLADACTAGSCAGSPKNCSDGDPCTTDSCKSGSCAQIPVAATGCDDANSCTIDACSAGQGCQHDGAPLDFADCDDGNACTMADVCLSGVCSSWQPTGCDDGNVCTADSCDPVKGCVHLAVTGACADDNPCTIDTCANGKCGVAKVDGTPCGGGTGCDAGAICNSGVCTGARAVWQIDSNSIQPGISASNTTGILYYAAGNLVMRSWGGEVAWEAAATVGPIEDAGNNWALQNYALQAIDILGKSGSILKSLSVPTLATKGYFGKVVLRGSVGANLLLEYVATGGEADVLARVSDDGAIVQTWQVPKGVEGGAEVLSLANGKVLWTVYDTANYGKSHFKLYLLPDDPTVSPTVIGPLTQPQYFIGDADGPLIASEAQDGSLFVVQRRKTTEEPGALSVFIWHLTADGVPLWNHVFALPDQPATSDYAYVAIAAISDGTVEVLAGPGMPFGKTSVYNQGFTSWRLAQDGRILWVRDEDQRRRPHDQPITAVGFGVGGNMWNYDGYLLHETVTRSDAYGNLSCAESGPCWDKPATWCDDGDSCTNDLCGAQWNGCHHEPFADGAPCMPGKTCKAGKCL